MSKGEAEPSTEAERSTESLGRNRTSENTQDTVSVHTAHTEVRDRTLLTADFLAEKVNPFPYCSGVLRHPELPEAASKNSSLHVG